MIRLLQFLIFGHVHEWETINSGELRAKGYQLPVGYHHQCRCKTCGKWKRFET